MEKFLRKNQNCFRKNRSTTSHILTIYRISEGVRAKKLTVTLLFVDFSKAFDSTHKGKMEQILVLLAYSLPKETLVITMLLYKTVKWKSSVIRWRHRLLWHCCWCSARGFINRISVHYLPRLHTSNVNRSNERKWLYTKKRQEVGNTLQKLLRTQTTHMTYRYCQIHLPKQNPSCIVWSWQQVVYTSLWMQIEPSICILIKKETYPH